MYVDTVIEICPPEVFQGLAKKGMEKADDRLQCSKTYTLSAGGGPTTPIAFGTCFVQGG